MSFGEYDRRMLEVECREKGVEYPAHNQHMNIKLLMQIIYNLPKQMGLAKALNYLGIELQGRQHSGSDDAFNSAKIVYRMFEDMKKTK
jgi:inhibitor of KinA sporulation pathway (predicted exonuclease)